MANLKEFNEQIDSKKYSSVLVFTGEETGLITQYVNDFKSKFKTIVDTDDIDEVIEDCKYNPLFGGGKLYILRESKLFNKKAEEKFINFLVRMLKQKSNVCLFVESKIDRKLKQTSAIGESSIINFDKLSEDQLIAFVSKIVSQSNKKMLKNLTRHFVDQCDYDYNKVMNEITKVLNYVGDSKEVTVDHINQVVTRSSRSVVFDLITFIVNQKYQRALDMLYNLLSKKEPPLVILTLMYRQIKLLYQIKLLKPEGYNNYDIAEACDSKPFIISKNLDICDFDTEKLVKLLAKCSEMDWKIKSGQIKDTLALELLILYSSIPNNL